MNQLILALATGLYVGKIPKAPGTFGSLFAFLPWFFMKDLSAPLYLAITFTTLVLGYFIAGTAEKLLDKPDAGPIVIDEIVGMFVTLFLVPAHPIAWCLGFLFFRFFDILKPFPVSWLDSHLHGGMGIMLDDVMAGIYAFIALHASWQLYLFIF